MLARTSRLLSLTCLGLMTLLIAGCGGSNLVDMARNPLGIGLCGLIILILDIIAILEIAGSSRDTGSKVLWSLFIIFFPLLGLIVYYLIGRR